MNDKLEKTLKELLPYIIIIGIIFLLLPLFMGKTASALTYIIQIGVFPLTAFGCGVFYKVKKKQNNLYLCLIAPIFYALAALLYGMWRTSWYTVLIYIVAYFLCGYLGQLLGDVLPVNKKDGSPRRRSLRPRRVNIEEKEAPADDFQAEDPTENDQLDTSTTDDDIEAILNNIHNRK
jgi:hypothetical protein